MYRSYTYIHGKGQRKNIELLYGLNYFPSLRKLIDIVQQKSPGITKEAIKQFHEKHITTQLAKEQRKEKPQRHVVAYYLNELWQLDIFDLARYQYFNKDHTYLLVGIDVFNRQAYAEPMINKGGGSVREAFIKMTKIVQPKTIMPDDESSFFRE